MSEYEPTYMTPTPRCPDHPDKTYKDSVGYFCLQLGCSWGADIRKKEAAVAERAAKVPNLTCFVDEFPLAMAAIAAVHDYERGPLVKGDYRPSKLRHLFKIGLHADHEAAEAWNCIAQLELRERARLAQKRMR